MLTEKIERLLGALSDAELHRLELFLESPYFLIPPAQVSFSMSYLKARRRRSWAKAGKEKRWAMIFPAENFDDGKWRKLKSYLLHWVEEFLLVDARQLEIPSLIAGMNLLEVYQRKGLEVEFESLLHQLMRQAAIEIPDGEQAILAQGKLWEIAYNHFIVVENPHKEMEEHVRLLSTRVDAFEQFVNFEYLRMANAIEHRRKMRRTETYLHLPANFANFLKQHRETGIPVLRCHIQLHDLLTGTKKDVRAFLQLFQESLPQIHTSEAKLLFDHAISMLVREYIKHPSREWEELLLEFYQMTFETDFLSGGTRVFPLQHFKNACVVGCRMSEYGFVESLINTKGIFLGKSSEAESTIGYCRALLHHSKGENHECIQILGKLDMERYLKIEIRALEIKAWCDLGKSDLAEIRIGSFERYLLRSKLPKDRKEAMLQRLRVTRRILFLDLSKKKEAKELRSLLQSRNVLDSEWLLHLLEAKLGTKPS